LPELQLTRRLILLALLILIAAAPVRAVEISLVYWGDRFARDFPQPIPEGDSLETGGAWQLAGIVDVFRKAIPATFVLAAGGDLAGTPAATHTNGLGPAKVLAEINPDAYSVGIVDFSYGPEALKSAANKAKLPMVLANGYMEGSGPLFPAGRMVSREGITIAVTGVAPKRVNEFVKRDLVKGLVLSDPIPAVQDFIASKKTSANLKIVLSQLGWEGDSVLAVAVPDIDVIIEGHSRVAYDPPRRVGKTLIVASEPGGLSVGRLTLEIDTLRSRFALKRNEFFPVRRGVISRDSGVKTAVIVNEQRFVRDRGDKVADLMTDWNINPTGPSNLAQWTADALAGASRAAKLSVFANADLERGASRGVLNERDIEEMFPFETTLLCFQITGKELRRIIEFQAAGGPFLTWGNLQVAVDKGKPTRILVGDYPFRDDEEFAVTTTGVFWDRFRENTGLDPESRPTFFFPTGLREYMLEMVEKQKMITAPLDNRWQQQ